MLILEREGRAKVKQRKKNSSHSGQCPDPKDQVQAPSLFHSQTHNSSSQEQSSKLRELSTYFSYKLTLEPGWQSLLAHASSCLGTGYHLKGCLAQGLPSLYRIVQTSKPDPFLDSSQDIKAGYLTSCFQLDPYPRTSQDYIVREQLTASTVEGLHSHTTERFPIRGKSKPFQKSL